MRQWLSGTGRKNSPVILEKRKTHEGDFFLSARFLPGTRSRTSQQGEESSREQMSHQGDEVQVSLKLLRQLALVGQGMENKGAI